MNRLLMSESPIPTKVRNLKSKRVLQVLQASASVKDLLVSPNLMSGNRKKPTISQKKTEVFQKELLSKENSPVVQSVRRSRRKNAVTQEEVKKTTSKEGTETKASSSNVSKVTKSKKTSTRKSKKQSSANLCSSSKQSKMDSFIACSSTSNTILESNLENEGIFIDNDMQLQKSENPVDAAVSPSYIPHSDVSLQDSKDSGIDLTPNMLTSAKPSEKYWEMLAEERRIALEQTLRENYQLQDQLEVLEAEKILLKDCIKEAEKLAIVFRQALE